MASTKLQNCIDVMSRSYTATGTISAAQPVGLTGAAAAGAAAILGIAKNDVVSGDTDSCLVMGEVEVVGSAAISAGAAIECAGSGKFVTKSSGIQVGRAITACSGNNGTFKAYICAAL